VCYTARLPDGTTDSGTSPFFLREQAGNPLGNDYFLESFVSDSTVSCGTSAAQQLANLIKAVTGIAPGSSYADKLTQVQADIAAGDTATTCSDLRAFINEVNAESGKKLTASQASALVASAQQIQSTLGC
jgi:hypothetical protein